MLNRDLIVVRLKQPFVDWVNEANPYPDGSRMTLEEANEDLPVFLIHDHASEDVEEWLRQCYQPLFEELLEQWYVDETLWPQELTLELFRAWCDVKVHGMLYDLVDEPLVDDDIDLSDRLLHEDG
ncbi:MAG: hypothetical protein R3E50_17100 [Halioglobus sp.]